MIDLSPEHLEKVRRILWQYVPDCEVRAYGSRVTGGARSYSDLDLAIVGNSEIPGDTLRWLKEAFEDSDLPFRVEVSDWCRIDSSFREVIENRYEVVQ